MITKTLKFGKNQKTVLVHIAEQAACFLNDEIVVDIQNFIDHVEDLREGEPFYFGFWRVVIAHEDDTFVLCEWDFESSRFEPKIEKSIRLWHEQRIICLSQNLEWHSVKPDSYVYFSPSVFRVPQSDVVEGVRSSPNNESDSGWLLYTNSDRQNGYSFERSPLSDLLSENNVLILRFLALPEDWNFNIDRSGASHIWEEALEDVTTH